MPPINQQGSRAGLVTGLVVFVILFVTSAIFAFQYYGKWQQAQANYDAYKKQYAEIVPAGQLSSSAVTDFLGAKNEQPNNFTITPTETAIEAAAKQRDGLILQITGDKASTASTAYNLAAKSLKDSQDSLDKSGVKVSLTGGLAKAVASLTNSVVAGQKTIAGLNADLKNATATAEKAQADVTAAATAGNQALKDAQSKAAADAAALNAAVEASKTSITQMQTDQAAAAKTASDAAAQKDSQIAAVTQQLNKANGTIEELRARLSHRRVDVTNAAVRQVDGKLIRVPNTDICYINLGYGDQVTPGLTFEVYDKVEGVPPIPQNVTGDEQLPVGKASIEITNVGTTSSQCRIVHITPGAVLSEGDPIENLVYDPHTKYNFFVFGNFDLANTGRPNPADAEVIKRLVTQWGGKLTDQVDVDADFVVLGSEPVLPVFTKDEITAENQDKLNKAQAALDLYQEKLGEARALHIPIMNQNRFLYYVGFYDQAKR